VNFLDDDAWVIDITDEVLRVKPRLSSLRWHERDCREAASRCLRQIVARGYLGSEDALEAVHQPNIIDADIYSLGAELPLGLNEPCRAVLLILKDLWKQGKFSAEGAVEIPLHRFTPKQIQQLERAVYSSGYVSLLPSEEAPAPEDSDRLLFVSLPHAHFPNGIPREAVLVCRVETKEGVLSRRSGVGVWSRFYDVVNLQRYLMDENNDREYFYRQRELIRIQRQGLSLSLRVAPFEITINFGL
jgi:hypothetical protein